MASRVLRTLVFLGLATADGQPTTFEPTDAFRAIRSARPESRYRQELRAVIEQAYEHIFKSLSPAQATFFEIMAEFQPFDPASQHRRMAILFCGLCNEAGIPLQQQLRFSLQEEAGTTRRRSQQIKARRRDLARAPALSDDGIWDLIRRLPAPASRFSSNKRTAWLKALGAHLPLVYDEYASEALR